MHGAVLTFAAEKKEREHGERQLTPLYPGGLSGGSMGTSEVLSAWLDLILKHLPCRENRHFGCRNGHLITCFRIAARTR